MHLRVLLFLLLLVLAPTQSEAAAQPRATNMLSCNQAGRCIVKFGPGGFVLEHMLLADLILANHRIKSVMIDGVCASACVVVADLARAKVCITPAVTFAFHRGSRQNAQTGAYYPLTKELPPYSRDIIRRVKKLGGFPVTNSLSLMTKMGVEDASQFWRLCTAADLM